MPEQKFVLLPANLVEDTRFRNKSMYVSDFCTRNRRIPERRHVRTKETPRHSRDIFDPSTRFLNDHYQTSNHVDLTLHCEKVLNSIERNKRDSDYSSSKGKTGHIYSGLPPTPVLLDGDEPIIDVLPPSLRRIEAEWQAEVNTTKRERGNIYGKAGAKTFYQQRQDAAEKDSSRKKLVPGLNKWLNEANEFEKQVVHNFMTNVSGALKEEKPTSEAREIENKATIDHHYYSDNPKIEDYLDSQLDIDDYPEVTGTQDHPLLHDDELYPLDEPPIQIPMQQHVSFRQPTYEDIISPRPASSLSSNESLRNTRLSGQQHLDQLIQNYHHPAVSQKQRTNSAGTGHRSISKYANVPRAQSAQGRHTQHALPAASSYNTQTYQRPNSRQRDMERAQSAQGHYERDSPTPRSIQRAMSADSVSISRRHHGHSHKDASCESCQEKEIKEMAKQLSQLQPSSFSKLKHERHSKPKMAAANMYQTSTRDYAFTQDDYVHKGSVFGKVINRKPGYFVIHPEWISEKAAPKKSYR